MHTLVPDVHSHDIHLLADGNHYDPHRILGLHQQEDEKVIRVWRPGAHTVHLEVFGKIVEAYEVHPAGLFEYSVPVHTLPANYRVYHQNGLLAQDPYTSLPTISDLDTYLFGKGTHYQLYNVLGARLVSHYGVLGVKFAVWAPGAKRVSLVGDFNHWNGLANPMRTMGSSGIWELFVPGLNAGEKYKFEIKTHDNHTLLKADPYALSSQLRPLTASVVADIDSFHWDDAEWLQKRAREKDAAKPMLIYELHLGSWRKRFHQFMNYRDIAQELVAYCHDMGFTHVELMPIQEHPLDQSWGYQVTGFYAATSRFGTPADFQWFVNHLHQNGIGIILDWVPGHFPTDDFSLARFDGTALYEHEDPRQGFHPHWNTLIFNYGRFEVTNFLIANALFWLEKMHIDGLRVDAVASILYLDYGREHGQWIPNKHGTKENIEAIEFLKHLNSIVHDRIPGALMIAEESTSFDKVSHPVGYGGLGFDLKWNMGWMNDTLRYFSTDMLYRNHHHNDLTFGLIYAFSEKFTLVLSHDEVVHGKKSLLAKMPGDVWQKFANMRLLYSYMICQPGKKLLFMGGEIGHWNEWCCDKEIDWNLLDFIPHNQLQTMIRDLNHFYVSHSALWERDFHWSGFEWVDFADNKNSVVAYLRKSDHGTVLCVHNCTANYFGDYFLPLKNVASIQEAFNSDALQYGGSGKLNSDVRITCDHNGYANGICVQLAPLATMIFKIHFW